MAQLFHKEVRIEDDRLAAEGGVIADDKIADGITEKRERGKKNTVTAHYFGFYSQLVCPEGDICWHRSYQSTPTALSDFGECSAQHSYISLWSEIISGLFVQHSLRLTSTPERDDDMGNTWQHLVKTFTTSTSLLLVSLYLHPTSSGRDII